MTDPINHNTREPHQPSLAVIVEGDIVKDSIDDSNNIDYKVYLDRLDPGNVEFVLIICNKVCGKLPFDNLVKAATRIDPEHAVGSEKQIQTLRREVSEARAAMYDWQAKAEKLEEKIRAYEASTKA